MNKVQFINNDRWPVLKNKKQLKLFIEKLFTQEGRELVSLTFIFCSDEFLLDINKRFLKHDFYTDIITFELSKSVTAATEGEVYISIDRVKDNSKQLSTSFNDELHRVIIHGVLHLCGYKDKKKPEQAQMRSAENRYLELYFK